MAGLLLGLWQRRAPYGGSADIPVAGVPLRQPLRVAASIPKVSLVVERPHDVKPCQHVEVKFWVGPKIPLHHAMGRVRPQRRAVFAHSGKAVDSVSSHVCSLCMTATTPPRRSSGETQ